MIIATSDGGFKFENLNFFCRDFWQQKHKAGDFSTFFFFFFFAGKDVGRSNFIVFVFGFFNFLSFKIKLPIHITFTLSKYDTERNLMFHQNISVKHRLSFLCFGNVRVDVDDGFFCLGIAV